MTPVLLLCAVVGGVVVARAWIVRWVEQRDAIRPRNIHGELIGAEGFVLDRPNAPGVLLLHGAGDTPQTLRELGRHLHERGFAVSAPLLPGHGRSVRDFRRVTATAWHAAALEAYDELHAGRQWTGIVGLSMGGALAAIIASERPQTGALVLLAPYLGLPRSLRLAATVSRVANLFSPYFSSQDPRSIRDPEAAAHGLAYGVFTPAAARALQELADTATAALPAIRTPTLIVQSRQDNRVAPGVAERTYARLGAADRRLAWVSTGGHVITVDYGKERVFELTEGWLIVHGAAALLRS